MNTKIEMCWYFKKQIQRDGNDILRNCSKCDDNYWLTNYSVMVLIQCVCFLMKKGMVQCDGTGTRKCDGT